MAKGTQPYRAAFWSNQYQPRNKSCPCLAIASRGNKNTPRIELQSTATKMVTKLMNWNQYRVGTLLQRVHTDCLGRKFSPQRSQYTALSAGRDSTPQSLSGYCACGAKNYWSEGQFWSRPIYLHKSLGHMIQVKCVQATRGIESLRGGELLLREGV